MTTENERERAQFDRDDTRPGEEVALVRVAVSGRDAQGRIQQYRMLGEVRETLENQTQAP